MKIRSLLALAGLAIGFAVPTFAQQTSKPDPQLREALLALAKKVDDAWNNNDAAAVAALYTKDAVEVTNEGPIYGREAIEKRYATHFASSPSNMVTKLVQVYPGLFGYQQLSADGELKIIE
jgi:ketosteroid isomerase-like protein